MAYIPTNTLIHQNAFLRIVDGEFDEDIKYEEHPYTETGLTEFEQSLISNIKIDSIFSYATDNDISYINVDLSQLNITKPSCIQYWFLDDKAAYTKIYNVGNAYTYDATKCAYHLVMAINITQEDIDKGITEKHIYISAMSNRDRRVFSQDTGEVAGYIRNVIDENGDMPADTNIGYNYDAN